jgi:hypothetical protein
MTGVHLGLQPPTQSPFPPFQRRERKARGDLSQQIMCTNLPWCGLGAGRPKIGQVERGLQMAEGLVRPVFGEIVDAHK